MSSTDSPPSLPAEKAPSPRVVERKGNPFVRSPRGGRMLSAMMLPWFQLRPPTGFGVLTTTGRRTGKSRPKCVRAIRDGEVAYIVAIGGARSAWVKNAEANPNVRLRTVDGRFAGRAREAAGEAEAERARQRYCETLNPFDFVECRMHRPGSPSEAKIKELHHSWFEKGALLVIELGDSRAR